MPIFFTPKSWTQCADALRNGDMVMFDTQAYSTGGHGSWKPTEMTANEFDQNMDSDVYLDRYRIVRVAPEHRFVLSEEAWDEFTAIIDKPLTDEQREALTNLLNTKTIFDK